VPDESVRKLYAVFNSADGTSRDHDLLLTTEDVQEALAYAQEHQGAVYMYDVSANGSLQNETIIYIDDIPS